MLSGTQTGCINHPGMVAVARCKQCGTPVCGSCIVAGPTGRFCSAACKDKHQAFAQRAQQYDGKARAAYFVRLRGLLGTIAVSIAVLAALGIVASFIEIPVLSNLTEMARRRLGF